MIKPGQLNLMTSGGAVAHAEEATGRYRGTLEGIQLWVALPEPTRHAAAAFEHHTALPQDELDGAVATVLVGDFGDLASPARHDTPLVGVDLNLHGPTTLPQRPEWEYAMVVTEGAVGIHGRQLPPGKLGTSAAAATSCTSTCANPLALSCSAGSRSRNRSSCGGTSWPAIGTRSTRRTRRGLNRTTGSAGSVPRFRSSRHGAVLAPGPAMTLEATVGRVRIDKQHRDAYQAQREVAKPVRTATENAGLERTLVELVNIRVSQINGCAYCLHVHVRDALLGGETTQRLAVLPAWRETTLFTAKERAALTLAESLTTLPDPRAQEQDYADAADVLTEEELSAISWVTIAMNSFNRLSIVSRHPIRTRPTPDH